MPSFLTQCSHCLTSFRVTDSQLEAADGLVRCGACLSIFSAAANCITLKQTPEEAAAAAPQAELDAEDEEFVVPELPEPELEPVALAQHKPGPALASESGADHDVLEQEDFDIQLGDLNLDIDEFDEPEDEEDEEEELPPPLAPRAPATRVATDKTELHRHLAQLEDDDALDPLDDEDLNFEEDPVMLDSAPRRGWLSTTALLLANMLLIAVLALQYAYANVESLDHSTSFAPFKPYFCRVLECPPPERSQLDQLVSEQLLVRSHPRYAQALEVNLVFRSAAAEAQPFPAIELGFHDTNNRLLANRLFQPIEYLPAELRTSDMPARSSYQVQLEMADPGSEAVNYTLVFRKP